MQNACMQDTFARATHSAARPSARATIGYRSCIQAKCILLCVLGLKAEQLTYTAFMPSARDDRLYCMQLIY